jgi:cytochrome c biogenesis protein CcmG, thiol:disulfide interchange protein DsbE
MRFAVPVIGFLLMVGLLGYGLNLDPKIVPSVLIDKPAPEFNLPILGSPSFTLEREQMLGQVWVLNVWASWCVSCRAEHEIIADLAQKKIVPVVGLNYKDAPGDAQEWLLKMGDPYLLSVSDIEGRTGIDWGVYGVPETFVIDKKGHIRYKHIGPVTAESLQTDVLPVIKELLG